MKIANFAKKKIVFVILIALILVGFVLILNNKTSVSKNYSPDENNLVVSGSFDKSKLKTDGQWKEILTPTQFHILREQGTELPFSGELLHNEKKGTYFSVGCDEPLFRSETKYDSGTGWPSFWAPIKEDALVLREDYQLGVKRIEVLDRCGNHLGHVFDDGPAPTGKRYCMNSIALKFVPD